MELMVQGVGRLGQDVKLTSIISEGKPLRVVYNSIAVYKNSNETFWIDMKILPPYSLKFSEYFKKGERISFVGVLENRVKTVETRQIIDVILNVQKCEHLK